ncbi:hypothetical protein MHB48_03715 [Psychrobacillus sp. FSL H8-0483]|uniref:hypothetical protein n=1 Tax=Psychrobacillus sp. FSL H8-0483 TaxID=2921389 RepID=UPI003159CAFC
MKIATKNLLELKTFIEGFGTENKMSTLKLQTGYLKSFIQPEELLLLKDSVQRIHEKMHKRSLEGNKFLGWLDYPLENHDSQIEEMIAIAKGDAIK